MNQEKQLQYENKLKDIEIQGLAKIINNISRYVNSVDIINKNDILFKIKEGIDNTNNKIFENNS
jgi:hypothetical protein